MRLLAATTGLLLATTVAARADLAALDNRALLAWDDAAGRFGAATASACPEHPGSADPAAVDRARDAFRALALRWQAARSWLVGPAVPPDLPSQVWFWPDPHGSATRQVAKAVREGTPQGVASTGLALAELVLFDPKAAGAGGALPARSCAVLAEVGRVQAKLARETAGTFAKTRVSDHDRRRLLFISMRDSLDRISQEKIARPLGLNIDTARGQRAEAWRSGLSIDLIAAALDAVEAIYLPPDGVAARLEGNPEGPELDRLLRDQFGRTRSALAAVDLPLDLAVTDPKERVLVEALLVQVQHLRMLVVERLAPAIGETLGFNALDGD